MEDVEGSVALGPSEVNQVAEMVRAQVMKALGGDTRAFLAVVGRLQQAGAAGDGRPGFGGLRVMELVVERDPAGEPDPPPSPHNPEPVD